MLKIKKYNVNIMNTNCYLVVDNSSGMSFIVDPGGASKELDRDLENQKNVEYIFLTHGHFDHISAAKRYKDLTNAKIVIGKDEKEFTENPELNLSYRFKRYKVEGLKPDIFVDDGSEIDFSDYTVKAVHTPGHTMGSFCYMLDKYIFSGDTLMKGCLGRSDLPTGNEEQLKESAQKLMKMDGDLVVYPGHGLETTIKDERNAYFRVQ